MYEKFELNVFKKIKMLVQFLATEQMIYRNNVYKNLESC